MVARSIEKRVALIDVKTFKRQEEIKIPEVQKQKLLHLATIGTVTEKAKTAGLPAGEIAEKLGLGM